MCDRETKNMICDWCGDVAEPGVAEDASLICEECSRLAAETPEDWLRSHLRGDEPVHAHDRSERDKVREILASLARLGRLESAVHDAIAQIGAGPIYQWVDEDERLREKTGEEWPLVINEPDAIDRIDQMAGLYAHHRRLLSRAMKRHMSWYSAMHKLRALLQEAKEDQMTTQDFKRRAGAELSRTAKL